MLEGYRDALLHERRGLPPFCGGYQVRRAEFVVLSPSPPVRQIFHRLVEFCFCGGLLGGGWGGARRTRRQEGEEWGADHPALNNSSCSCHHPLHEAPRITAAARPLDAPH